jgi:putative ABC transport system permease protein
MSLIHDCQTGLRSLARRPAATVPAVVALALALGLGIATFSAINAFLFRPLAITDIEQVVRLRETVATATGEEVHSLSAASFEGWRGASEVFTDMAAATGGDVTLTGSGDPERLQAGMITANFFGVLGIRPRLGRDFAVGEDGAGRDGVVLLSDRVWDQRFQRDPAVLGRVLTIDGLARTVVGVLPRNLHHPYSAEIWIPLRMDVQLGNGSGNFLYVPARLRAGVTLAQADQSMDAVASAVHGANSRGLGGGAHLTPLRDELLGDLRPVLWLLLGGAAFVLAIAVLNVGNLMYARGVLEARDTAVRTALGARPRDLFRRALAANLALVGVATAIGISGAALVLEPLLGLSGAASIDEFDAVARLDLPTLGFAVVAALAVAAVLAGLEAQRARRVAPTSALGGETRGGSLSRPVQRRLRTLVAAQCALSFAVAAGAVLVTEAYDQLTTMDRGYRSGGVWLADIAFPERRYPDGASRERFLAQVIARLEALPGVERAGAASVTPDFPGSWGASFTVPGREAPTPPGYELVNHRLATAGYFEALGIPLLAGRGFDAGNSQRDLDTVIVDRDFAEAMWPGSEAGNQALGKTLERRTRGGARTYTVVGVVGNVAESEQASDWTVTRTWYLPTSAGTDYDFSGMTLVVHVGAALPGFGRQFQEAVWAVDRELAVSALMPMPARLAETYSRERFSGFLYGMFGSTALAIALVGLYAALAFLTAARRKEFGIRLALGALPGRLVVGIAASALRLATVGVAAGLPLAWWLSRRLVENFEGLTAVDPTAFVLPALGLLAVGTLAALIPAMGAARVDPMGVLRED